jgi:hypothetical protein
MKFLLRESATLALFRRKRIMPRYIAERAGTDSNQLVDLPAKRRFLAENQVARRLGSAIEPALEISCENGRRKSDAQDDIADTGVDGV